MDSVLVYASSTPPQAPATTSDQPKPGIIMIITFENGTTKAIRSESTNIQTVNGGYFISDSSVKASQPFQSKAVSNTVVQQLVSVFVDVRIDDPLPLSPPTSSEGCGEGFGYHVDDPSPICEPLDSIGLGPPPDQAFCAALGCPYNPPADSELPVDDSEINNDNIDFATTPVTPTEAPAVGPQPPPSEPGDQNGRENQNEDGDGDDGDGDGSTEEGEGDSSGGDESESEE